MIGKAVEYRAAMRAREDIEGLLRGHESRPLREIAELLMEDEHYRGWTFDGIFMLVVLTAKIFDRDFWWDEKTIGIREVA